MMYPVVCCLVDDHLLSTYSPLSRRAVETSFKVAGGAFGLLGGWLRDRVHDLGTTLATILGMPLPPPQQQQQPAEHVEGQEQTAGGNRRRGGAPPRNKVGCLLCCLPYCPAVWHVAQ
jgi:hypothetical protein